VIRAVGLARKVFEDAFDVNEKAQPTKPSPFWRAGDQRRALSLTNQHGRPPLIPALSKRVLLPADTRHANVRRRPGP
jgi:hypothetical protein